MNIRSTRLRISFCALAVTAAGAAAAPASAAPASAHKDAVRTLDAITIEGEIAVPQVLFITARDVRRFRDGLARTYRPGPLDIVRSIDTPRRVVITNAPRSIKEDTR